MATPSPLAASVALDELVDQFADPLSFFRELIQNSLDAGSAEVEVRIEYEPANDGIGAMIIHVDDWGEGMDREIIDKRLTRLFSSAKAGDMTKIGKFGIGFVSVFAIAPQAVVVDTSRGGEHWRIIFDEQRSFTRLRREHPVEGTKVSIYKSATREEHDEFVARAERTVRHWCKHTQGEIRFQGVAIHEPFDLEAPARVLHDDGFSTIVVGHPGDGRSFFGFYKHGLTLMEGHQGYLDGLAFKVSSPHLAHTLTRDDVIRDEAFEKVMTAVRGLVGRDLALEVFAQLERCMELGGHEASREYLFRAALWHCGSGTVLPAGVEKRSIFPLCAGGRASLSDCREILRRSLGPRRLLWSPWSNPLTDALRERGVTVFELPAASAGVSLLRWISQEDGRDDDSRLQRADASYCRPLLPTGAAPPGWTALTAALTRLLSEHGLRLSSVCLGHFRYPGSPIAERVAITQERPGELDELAEVGELGGSLLSTRRALVVNADHPAVATFVALAGREAEFAAYQLAKLFMLGTRLDVGVDCELAHIAVEQRWQRSTS